MEVKGTAVIPIATFVRDRFSDRRDEWLNSLSPGSANIMKNALPGGWYPLKDAIVEPTQKICDLFYSGKEKGAIEVGKYSADYGLKGVYKLFVRLGSPSFIVSRASHILPTYYQNSTMKVVEEKKTGSVLHITNFPDIDRLVELRIEGWIERALEICGCKNITVDTTKSLTKGDAITEYTILWE